MFTFIRKACNDACENEQTFYARPLELRPLTLKNEDNKAVAGVVNRSIVPVAAKHAAKIQRGFVKDRQLLQNVVDLDFECRVGALKYGAQSRSLGFDCNLSLVREGCVGSLPVLLLFGVVPWPRPVPYEADEVSPAAAEALGGYSSALQGYSSAL